MTAHETDLEFDEDGIAYAGAWDYRIVRRDVAWEEWRAYAAMRSEGQYATLKSRFGSHKNTTRESAIAACRDHYKRILADAGEGDE